HDMNKTSLSRFFSNQCSPVEREEIIRWLLDPSNDLLIKHWLRDHWESLPVDELVSVDEEPDMEQLWGKIRSRIKEDQLDLQQGSASPKFPKNHFRKLAVAALFIGVLLTTYFIYTANSFNQKGLADENVQPSNDIAPPNQARAILRLADGSTVYLDSNVNGTLARQGGIDITRNEMGEIIYSGSAPDAITMNTLSLPKGSKPIRLVLADGSLVWLNAASSITYPTAFVGKERKVSITGEAYFEVSENKAMPFFVEHNQLLIKVLGTHFNVNTYENEAASKVTLLSGLVDVGNGKTTKQLIPGQQASVSKSVFSVKENIDTDEVMAWKNGQFYFGGSDIKSIMKQIERYYDVEVEFRDEIPYQFVAKISRDVNVSAFLEKLELTNLIHFKIEGKKIIVMK
ncbi:MAG: FecR domain-containing protein, partial [Chitinophagaceae bacterium]|nr:FecR domain-containing protein [Chitinophagaceae bacterium]